MCVPGPAIQLSRSLNIFIHRSYHVATFSTAQLEMELLTQKCRFNMQNHCASELSETYIITVCMLAH